MVMDSECFKSIEEQFEDHTNPELWELKKGDQLFGGGDDKFWDLPLEDAAGNLHHHVRIYKSSADRLVTVLLCGRRALGDFYDFYPIMAMYRHYIELALKETIYISHHVLCRDLSTTLRKNLSGRRGHDIAWLWQRAKTYADAAGKSEGQEFEWGLVDDYIAQVDKLPYDLGRYPWTADGERVELPDETMNLVNMRLFMSRLGGYLEGTAEMLGIMLDARNEFADY